MSYTTANGLQFKDKEVKTTSAFWHWPSLLHLLMTTPFCIIPHGCGHKLRGMDVPSKKQCLPTWKWAQSAGQGRPATFAPEGTHATGSQPINSKVMSNGHRLVPIKPSYYPSHAIQYPFKRNIFNTLNGQQLHFKRIEP